MLLAELETQEAFLHLKEQMVVTAVEIIPVAAAEAAVPLELLVTLVLDPLTEAPAVMEQ
jgi:NADH:ubiquinone oxidoreductase subunit K